MVEIFFYVGDIFLGCRYLFTLEAFCYVAEIFLGL